MLKILPSAELIIIYSSLARSHIAMMTSESKCGEEKNGTFGDREATNKLEIKYFCVARARGSAISDAIKRKYHLFFPSYHPFPDSREN